MEEYLVTMDRADRNNIFIVSAQNTKDAINHVFEKYFFPMNSKLREENKEWGEPIYHIYTKSDLIAKSIKSLHKRGGRIVCVN